MRACAAVIRGDTILMVRHAEGGRVYWTLPGGGVQRNEAPEAAALRELREEARLEGRVTARLYEDATEICFEVEVDPDANPALGNDPEMPADAQMLVGIAWHRLGDMALDTQVARVVSARSRR